MFERPDVGERAVLVHIEFSSHGSEAEDLGEFRELVTSAGVEAVTPPHSQLPHSTAGREL